MLLTQYPLDASCCHHDLAARHSFLHAHRNAAVMLSLNQSHRVEVHHVDNRAEVARSLMTQADYDQHKQLVRAFDADYLCDMGGELSEAYLDREPNVKGALEATTSGLNVLRDHDIPFPVFDWNSIPLKDRLENRLYVGNEVWPVFSEVTWMSLFRRSVLVVGYGPVGKGIGCA